MSQVNEPKLPC